MSSQAAGVGCRPYSAAESSHSAAYSLNVGNLRDTGHSAEATPPAAMAEQETFAARQPNFRFGSRPYK